MKKLAQVNNALYDELGERWYQAKDDPVALLRAESRLRNPWVAGKLAEVFGPQPCRVLDVGCGAGFLSNSLALHGHEVVGLDASEESLSVARAYDSTGQVSYERGDALWLPYLGASFDVVCAMDFLEHVEDPAQVVREASRVLRPGGLFFFHTFNRNPLAWLIIIKGVEWLLRSTPPELHVLRLFIKPRELRAQCQSAGLMITEMRGVRPVFLSRAFAALVFRGVVSGEFSFKFTPSLSLAYSGMARKSLGLSK